MEQSIPTFKYNSKKYALHISLGTSSNDDAIAIDTKSLSYAKYENALNQLYLTGEFEYIDSSGALDRFIEDPYAYCDFSFCVIDERQDGGMIIETTSETEYFAHRFYISNIQIRNRKRDMITYRVSLVGYHYYNCLKNIQYSNYSQPAESILKICRNCMIAAGLRMNYQSRNNVSTNVRIKYISQKNDNLLTIIPYLFDKLFYYQDKDDSLKFIQYDQHDDIFNIFDIKDKATYTGGFTTVLSFIKSDQEGFVTSMPNQLATVVKMPNTDAIRSLFSKKFTDYDYSSNEFLNRDITYNETIQYANASFDDNVGCEPKTRYALDRTYVYENAGAYWNNNYQSYYDLVNNITQNNTLILNTSGELRRMPGSLNLVKIDRTGQSSAYDDDPLASDRVKRKFRGLGGHWFAYKVVNYIEPNSNIFTQNVVLMRNFKPTFD